MNVPLLILLVVFLIALSAFFSSTEIAFAQANKPRVKSLADDGDKKAVRAQKIIRRRFVRRIRRKLIIRINNTGSSGLCDA